MFSKERDARDKEFSSREKDETVQNLRSASQSIREAANDAQEGVRKVARNAGQNVRQFLDETGEDITQATQTVTAHIKDKPVQSSLMALGMGVILGMLLRR